MEDQYCSPKTNLLKPSNLAMARNMCRHNEWCKMFYKKGSERNTYVVCKADAAAKPSSKGSILFTKNKGRKVKTFCSI